MGDYIREGEKVKSKRQAIIMDFIRDEVVETQTELVDRLREKGLDVTQATVSRDIKELSLIKIPVGDGRYRYAVPPQKVPTDIYRRARMRFLDSVVGIDYTLNQIIIKTHPGEANAVAAVVDDLSWPEIVGTLAGDDSILVIVRVDGAPDTASVEAQNIVEKFEELRG